MGWSHRSDRTRPVHGLVVALLSACWVFLPAASAVAEPVASGEPVASAGGELPCKATVDSQGSWSCTVAVVVPAQDLWVDLDLPDRIVDTGVATVVVRSSDSGASGVVVTLTLPEGLAAAGAATGAQCTGEKIVICSLDRQITRASPPVGPNGQPVSLVSAGELGGSAMVTVPLRATVLCRSVPVPGTGRATVTNGAPDLDRTNDSDTDSSTLVPGGIGCQAVPSNGPKGAAAFLYIGLLLGSLGLTVGLGGWAWARRSDRLG